MRCADYPASVFMWLGCVRCFWRKTAKKTKGRKTTWALGSMFLYPEIDVQKKHCKYREEKGKGEG